MAAAEPPRRRPRKATTQSVQSAVEGVVVDDEDKIEFMGEQFMMAKSIGLMPLLKFAHAANQGVDSNDMEGLDAMYLLIADCLDQTRPTEERENPDTGEPEMVPVGPSEYMRFEKHAIDVKADGEALMAFVQKVIERLAARPTKRPGDASAGPQRTSANLRGSSSRLATKYPGLEGMVSPDDLGD